MEKSNSFETGLEKSVTHAKTKEPWFLRKANINFRGKSLEDIVSDVKKNLEEYWESAGEKSFAFKGDPEKVTKAVAYLALAYCARRDELQTVVLFDHKYAVDFWEKDEFEQWQIILGLKKAALRDE